MTLAAPIPVKAGADALLCEEWQVAATDAGWAASPADLPSDLSWISGRAPGTVASALTEDASWSLASWSLASWSLESPAPLADRDWWYVSTFVSEGAEIIRFEGLATLADVFLDDVKLLSSNNMFEASEILVAEPGQHTLHIAFRSLAQHLRSGHHPAGRWRPRMITSPALRAVRTTLLGHMPGWCPPVDAIGPWRPIRRIDNRHGVIRKTQLQTEVDGATGCLRIAIDVPPHLRDETAIVACAGQTTRLTRSKNAASDLSGTLRIPDVPLWFPHTHGTPARHDVVLEIAGRRVPLGTVGFRKLTVDTGDDDKGFGLRVNDVPIFCRGAVWATSDIVGLRADREHLEPLLRLARDAGMNMLRITGTSLYASPDFLALCDELGLMVWQDLTLANFDYPFKDDAWRDALVREVDQFLVTTQGHASLAVVCGGSEVFQQAAMFGFPKRYYDTPLFSQILPERVAAHRPDTVWVANSPSGGPVPFQPDQSVGHYYGVGAYQRGLEDIRRANVKFASETLGFSHVPEPVTLDRSLPGVPAVHDPRWKARVPRDLGAAWDFEDIRDHYLAEVFNSDPASLRYEDPEQYLALSRAVTAHVMETAFAEWMRPGSVTRGALVWLFQDLWAGAGWGIVDAHGEPKSPWFALRRAFQPVRVSMTDEGTNGLAIHIVNETAEARELKLALSVQRHRKPPLARATKTVTLPPRDGQTLNAYDVLGAFLDLNYAYRFGPLDHVAVAALLRDATTGQALSEAFYFPQAKQQRHDIGLSVMLESEDCDAPRLVVSCESVAQFVHINDAQFRPDDNYFHLMPSQDRVIPLRRRDRTRSSAPFGTVSAVNSAATVSYGSPS